MPEVPPLLPMKAVSGDLPPDDGRWAFEIKWDGMRVLTHLDGEGGVRATSSRGHEAAPRFPELQALADHLDGHAVVLDGEIVAFDDGGRPSFAHLQRRMHVSAAATVARLRHEVPVTYAVFDLLHLDGLDLTPLPWHARRDALEELVGNGPTWRVPAAHRGGGAALLDVCRQQALEGVIAKRVDSTYQPGRRSPDWVKVKVRRTQEFVVAGWIPGRSGLAGRLGSLVVGVHDDDGLRYAGRVGSGIGDDERDRLERVLGPLAVDRPTAHRAPAAHVRDARWVRPELVVQVAFGEWTPEGYLRHPSYLGARDDKDPAEVVREPEPYE